MRRSRARAGWEQVAYPLLSGVGDVFVGLEERSYVDCLAAPDVPVHRPVEGQFQRPPVERAAEGNQPAVQRTPKTEGKEAHSAACRDDMMGRPCGSTVDGDSWLELGLGLGLGVEEVGDW